MAVSVTDTAAREIYSIIREQDLDPEVVRLRVGVKGGGCAGFNYILDLTENQKDSDEVWEHTCVMQPVASAAAGGRNGNAPAAVADEPGGMTFTVRVVCDPKSYLYLNGTTIDFKDEIMGRGFVFSNPNASSSCGCGSSFAV